MSNEGSTTGFGRFDPNRRRKVFRIAAHGECCAHADLHGERSNFSFTYVRDLMLFLADASPPRYKRYTSIVYLKMISVERKTATPS